MSDFTIHTTSEASGDRETALRNVEKLYGSVPNVLGGMAESPAALNGYLGLADAMAKTTFTPTERHVVWFTINREHGCHYCMAAHTPHAMRDNVADDVIETARAGGTYTDPKLEALRTFTLAMVQHRGWMDDAAVNAFLAAGFTRENIFEVILAIAHKVMTNYTNHIVEPELDDRFADYRWGADDATADAAD